VKRFVLDEEKVEIIMPLVTSESLLLDAQKNNYAVGAFNAENMEMLKAIVETAEELRSPVIIQTTPSTVKYGGLRFFYGIAAAAAQEATIPVVLHLDHGESFDMAVQAVRLGYTSIMIDGSHKSFEDNINITKSVVAVCRPNLIPVEAELGKVGGKEDGLETNDPGYTDPQEAKEFVQQTGISSLAVAIGTAHGFYKGIPVLDKKRLSAIRKLVDIPLVLHGASGLSDEEVRECIERGICKVNFATELRAAYTFGVRKVLRENTDAIDPKLYGKAGMAQVKALVKNRMFVCKSEVKY
jgi:tagatose 1,6-diphosphate aldolase GatY/KbaY